MPTIPQRIASAFAVLCGRYGDVTEMAKDREQSRQSLYREAEQVVEAVDGAAAQARIDELQRQLAEQQAEVQALQERLKHAVEITPDKQHEFATVAQAEGVSLSVARRLLRVVAGPRATPSVATLGRATLEAGKQAGPLARGARRGGPARGQTGHRRRDFFGRKPVLMVVEPESLCWLTGRMVEARDGVTWAEEFARFPALEAVVRDDGTGLGKGVKLERARRRAAGLPDLDDSLDVFHTLREGGRALRKTWGAAARALERADAAQKGLRPARPSGAIAPGSWRAVEPALASGRADSGIKPRPPRRPGNRPGRRSSSSPPKAASTTGLRPRRSSRRRCRTWAARRGPRPGGCCSAGRASRSWIRCKDGWPSWGWTPTSCRRCWTWKVCVASPGACRPPHGPGPWSARSN